MKRCDVCGNASFHEERIDEIFEIDAQMVMVEHIPAQVCDRCGDATFDRETTEQVRRMVHGQNQPTRHLNLDVFAFV